jgi:hypothetical protein
MKMKFAIGALGLAALLGFAQGASAANIPPTKGLYTSFAVLSGASNCGVVTIGATDIGSLVYPGPNALGAVFHLTHVDTSGNYFVEVITLEAKTPVISSTAMSGKFHQVRDNFTGAPEVANGKFQATIKYVDKLSFMLEITLTETNSCVRTFKTTDWLTQ